MGSGTGSFTEMVCRDMRERARERERARVGRERGGERDRGRGRIVCEALACVQVPKANFDFRK